MKNIKLFKNTLLSHLFILIIVGVFSISVSSSAQSALDTLGNFWSPISGISNGDIKTISVDSSGFIYVSIWGEGLMRSTNAGTSWTDITHDLPFPNITAIEFDSTGKIFLGTLGGGVFVSTNNGNSWSAVNSGLTNKRVTALKIFRGGPMYVGTIGGGVYKSTNGGRAWVQSNMGLKFPHITAMILSEQGAVVVGTPNEGVWRSTDEAKTWGRGNGSISSRNITSFAKNAIGELVVGTLGGGVCFSIDGGGGWTVYHKDDKCVNVTAVVFADANEPVAGLAQKGIVRFDDRIWEQWRLTSMRSTGITALARTRDNTLWAAIPLMGLYKSTNNGANWTNVSFTKTFARLEVFGAKDGWVMSTKNDTNLLISSDYGVTWTGNKLPNHKITAFGLDSTGAFLVGAVSIVNPPTGYLYRSVDHGENWVPLWAKRDTSVVAIAVNTQGHIYCGLSFPPADPKDPNAIIGELFVSTNTGVNWAHINANPTNQGFEFIGINYNDDIYVNLNGGLFKSEDAGANWTRMLNENVAQVASIGFSSIGDVYCATNLGLFKSTNDGQNWTTNDFGISGPDVKKIIVTMHDQVIVGLAYQEGFLCSADGDKFYEINRGFIHSYLWSMSQSRDGFIYIATNTMYRGIEPPSLPAPIPAAPANNAEGIDRNATFTWRGNDKTDMYEFQISDSPDFFIVGEKLTVSGTSHKLNYTLKPAKRYFWRVRSRTNSAMSAWSDLMVFMTVIEPPELISPENHSGSNSVKNLSFIWHQVDSASLYKFELATDARFANIVSSQEVADTTVVVENLNLYTKYYWRVRGRTFKADGPWSEVWDFYTKLRPPVLKSPPDKSTGMKTVVLLEWFETEGGTKYEVQLARDSLFVDMVFESLTETNTSQHTRILEYNKTYWWRIRGLNDDGQSDWSTAWKFTTTLTAAELISPENKSEDLNTDILFKWKAASEATHYHIQISKNGGFTDIVFQDSTLKADSIRHNSFEHFTNYYWRVRKYKNGVPGLWSDVWTFVTGLGQVVITSPSNGATKQPTDMTFNWEMLKGADTYIFQLSKSSDFSTVTKQSEITKTQIAVNKLDNNQKYYFRIKGKYSKGEGEWSETREFTTQESSGVDYEAIPGMVEFRVYPNPFASKLSLEFNLSYASQINVKLSDINGRTIATLENGTLPAGTHTLEYQPKGIEQGTYLIILSVDGNQSVKQVIFIK